jgi:WD40 repeat protein
VLLFQVGASPAETRPCIRQPVHEKTILNMGYSADGSLLLTGSSDGTAAVWPVRAQRPPTLLRGHGSEVFAVAITPDGQQVITGTGAGRIERFRVSDGALMFSESVGTSAVSAIAIPNGESAPPLCAAALWDGRTILFSHGEKPMHQMSLHSGRSRTQSVAWRRVDEKKHWAVLSVSAEGRVLQSELSLPDETHPPVVSPEQLLVEAGTPTRWAEFSSDGGHLVLLHVDGGATVHALRGSSKVGLPLLGHQSSIATVHFDSAGTHVITAARDGTARRIKLPPQDVAQLNPVQLQKALAEVRGVCLPIEDRQNVDRQEATKEYWQCMHKRGQTDLAIAGPAAARAPKEDGIKRPKAARRRKADSG